MTIHTLEVDSVIKSYDDIKLLSNIYLICKTNEILGVFGRNGVGKSTLLKIIFGIEDCENKFIRIDDTVLDKPYLVKNQISYLPQNNFIPKNISVNHAINLFLEKEKVNDFKNDEIINLITNKKINILSGGELRYLEIKLILFSESKFVLLDEPYNGLSPILIEEVNNLIKTSSLSKGIIITDHNYQYVLEIITKTYILKSQKLNLLSNNNMLFEHGYLSRNNS